MIQLRLKAFIFTFIFLLQSVALAAPTCDNSVSQQDKAVAQIAENFCHDKNKNISDNIEGQILNGLWGCITGVPDDAWTGVKAIGFFAKLIAQGAWAVVKGMAEMASESAMIEADPTYAASLIHKANSNANNQLWDYAKVYLNAFIDFAKVLANKIKALPGMGHCLSWQKILEYGCRALADTFLAIVTPAKILSGAKWGAELVEAIEEILKAAKLNPALEGSSASQKLKTAAKAIGQAETRGQEVSRFGRYEIVEYSNAKGEKYLKLEESIKDASGKMTVISREIAMDAKTGAINANVAKGRELYEAMIESGKGDVSVIFIDVNNLGKVNYFKQGSAAGDNYLSSVADATHAALRDNDVLFRTGGDELVAVVQTANPEKLQTISERIVEMVSSSPKARQVFTEESRAMAEKYKVINAAKSVDDLPPEMVTTDRVVDFAELKSQLLAKQTEAMKAHTAYRPSVSIGSSVVDTKDTLASVIQRTEGQAAMVKAQYKFEMGLPVDKYGAQSVKVPEVPVTKNLIRPKVQPPVNRPSTNE